MKLLITGGSGFIGTNLINELRGRQDYHIVNVDKRSPKIPDHFSYWVRADILDGPALRGVFSEFQPTHVVHLAARTDTDGDHLSEYVDNVDGTRNVLAAIQQTMSVERSIITSTQFVNNAGVTPASDTDFAPHTVYGESKVVNERDTRAAKLGSEWIIIRPTNIWGPWHPRYPSEFWKVLSKGYYFHPAKGSVIRSYGYVGNVVNQIHHLLLADSKLVSGRVLYVGDQPIHLDEWVDCFSELLIGRPARRVPVDALRVIAGVGDVLKSVGIRFPLTSSRLISMTSSNVIDMSPTFTVCGNPRISLREGVEETVKWLHATHGEAFRRR